MEKESFVLTMFTSLQSELAEQGRVDFIVRARPSASQTKAVEQLEDQSIKIAIAAAPENGKANIELVSFLANEFGVPKTQVELVSGHTSKVKHIRIRSTL